MSLEKYLTNKSYLLLNFTLKALEPYNSDFWSQSHFLLLWKCDIVIISKYNRPRSDLRNSYNHDNFFSILHIYCNENHILNRWLTGEGLLAAASSGLGNSPITIHRLYSSLGFSSTEGPIFCIVAITYRICPKPITIKQTLKRWILYKWLFTLVVN